MTTIEIKDAARSMAAFLNEKENAGKDVSKLDAINVEAIQEEVNRSWTFEVWDKKSPINGRDADFVLLHKKDEIPAGGQVYLLKREGQVVYLQGHNPKVEGYVAMTTLDVESIGLEHLQQVVDNEVVQAVVSQL